MVKMTVFIAAFAAASLTAHAAPEKMSTEKLDQVVAGTFTETPTTTKGNNGWGNGADGTNAGSFAGPTSPSKIAGGNLTGANKINTNPTTSTGR